MSEQTVGNCFEFFDYVLLKETFWEEMRYDLIKKCISDKTFISFFFFFFYFLYALLALTRAPLSGAIYVRGVSRTKGNTTLLELSN